MHDIANIANKFGWPRGLNPNQVMMHSYLLLAWLCSHALWRLLLDTTTAAAATSRQYFHKTRWTSSNVQHNTTVSPS